MRSKNSCWNSQTIIVLLELLPPHYYGLLPYVYKIVLPVYTASFTEKVIYKKLFGALLRYKCGYVGQYGYPPSHF